MATVEQSYDKRFTILETEFRTELKHLATKADLKSLEARMTLRLGGLILGGAGLVVAGLRFWQ